MPIRDELSLDSARVWVEFPDPSGPMAPAPPLSEDAEISASVVIYRVDLTWFTSAWHCVFGQGCPGILLERPNDGCCSLGAHFTDEDDQRRVKAAAQRLTPQTWANYRSDVEECLSRDEDGDVMTTLQDGACIFLNPPGFPAGSGCSLHHLAMREGVPHHTVKPDVCWQLPIRRSYRDVERPDGTHYQEITLAEFDRRGWGAGGHHLDWYCTTSPLAHSNLRPVYRYVQDELIEMMGEAAYAELVRHCEAFERRMVPGGLGEHPATTAARRFHDEATAQAAVES